MTALSRLAGAYLVLLAVSVALHFVITPWYHPGGDLYPVWAIHDYFMAAGMLIGIVVCFLEKRRVDGDPEADLKLHLGANVLFYATVGLFLLFFWNWFQLLAPNTDPSGDFWTVIDASIPLVLGAAGCRLWRSAAG